MFKEIDLWENEPLLSKEAMSMKAFEELLNSVSFEDAFEPAPTTASTADLINEKIKSYGATTYEEALKEYQDNYGKRKHWLVDPSQADNNDLSFFKFVLHCYNKFNSSIAPEKNIPAHWAKYFTSKDAKEMKPFGDFGQYHEIEDITPEDIYADQIEKLFEIRDDCIKPSSLYNEAVKILEARAQEVVGHSLLEENDYRWALCAIIANGSLNIHREILTVQWLKENYEDDQTVVERAPGKYENSGIDALFLNRETGEEIETISIKCGKAFSIRTFQNFQYKYGKNKVTAYAGFNEDVSEAKLIWAKDVPKP